MQACEAIIGMTAAVSRGKRLVWAAPRRLGKKTLAQPTNRIRRMANRQVWAREALIRFGILAVALLISFLTGYATGSRWALVIALAVGLFAGPSLVGAIRARRFGSG